jgi:hypothetical protein
MVARFHPILEDEDGGELIDHGSALFDGHIGFAEDAIGFDGGQALVPEMDGKVEILLEYGYELPHFLGLAAFGAAHAEREADDELDDAILLDDGSEGGKVGSLVLAANGDESLGGETEGVGDGQTDGP